MKYIIKINYSPLFQSTVNGKITTRTVGHRKRAVYCGGGWINGLYDPDGFDWQDKNPSIFVIKFK